jgi:HEPN domain-containing protein
MKLFIIASRLLKKLAKGIFALLKNDKIPRIHDIENIITRFEDKLTERISNEHSAVLAKLTGFYVDDRYPTNLGDKSVYDKTIALHLISQAKEIFEWLLKSLPTEAPKQSEQSNQSPKP